MTRILGIDPGYDRLGVGVIDKNNGNETLVYSTCVTTSPKDPFDQRLLTIGAGIRSIITQHSPTQLAIEKTFFNTNQKTAIGVSEARGVILYEAAQAQLTIHEYTPPQIKLAITGYGHSTKKQIMTMVAQLITITEPIQYDDEYDAIAVALTHAVSVRS